MVKDAAELVAALKKRGLLMSAKILIVAEHDGGKLNASTAKCVTCARALDGRRDHHRGVRGGARRGRRPGGSARRRRRSADARRTPPTRTPLAAVLAPQIVALAAPYTHVLGPSTTFGKDLMPRVAGAARGAARSATSWRSRARRASAARSTPATRSSRSRPSRAEGRRHGAHRLVRGAPAGGGAAPIEKADGERALADAHALRIACRAAKTRPPRPADRHARGLRRPGARQRRELQDPLQPRRQARRGGRRLARGGRCRLRAERDAGGTDRQDHRARAVHRGRHLRARSST